MDVAAYVYNSVVLLHGAKYVEATELPLAALGDEDGRRPYVSMDRACVIVYESDDFLGQLLKEYSLKLRRRTAMLCKPHFIVSWGMLFRLICHDAGVSRSVAMYMCCSDWR
jgi:hypothetical protein